MHRSKYLWCKVPIHLEPTNSDWQILSLFSTLFCFVLFSILKSHVLFVNLIKHNIFHNLNIPILRWKFIPPLLLLLQFNITVRSVNQSLQSLRRFRRPKFDHRITKLHQKTRSLPIINKYNVSCVCLLRWLLLHGWCEKQISQKQRSLH